MPQRHGVVLIMTALLCGLFVLCANAEETVPETKTAADAPQAAFAFLWLTDTQKIAGHGDEYRQTGEWLLGELEPRNTVMFLHTGDIVGMHGNKIQWERARAALDPIREKLPTLAIPGNHDINAKTRDYEPFRKNWYGEEETERLRNDETSFERGRGRYMLGTFGGIDFLFVGMGYDTTPAAMDWVEEVLDRYPDRIAVLLMHDYLNGDGRIYRRSREQFDRMIAPHENVRLILSGHNSGYFIRRDDMPSGRFTQSILLNMQDDNGRRGTVQFLTIDPEASTLTLWAWSPVRPAKEPIEAVVPIDLAKH